MLINEQAILRSSQACSEKSGADSNGGDEGGVGESAGGDGSSVETVSLAFSLLALDSGKGAVSGLGKLCAFCGTDTLFLVSSLVSLNPGLDGSNLKALILLGCALFANQCECFGARCKGASGSALLELFGCSFSPVSLGLDLANAVHGDAFVLAVGKSSTKTIAIKLHD